MSIYEAIAAHVRSDALIPYRPIGKRPPRRLLFLTRNAATMLSDPHSAVGLLVSRGVIENAMTRWAAGERINGRWIAGTLRCGFMCRLTPPPPEIWDIRITQPIVRWRVFGRFAAPDTFIATSMHTRTLLGRRDSSAWAAAMKDCERAWQKLFPTTTPFTAARASDYITENCDDFAI